MNKLLEEILTPEQATDLARALRLSIAREAALKKDVLNWGWALMPEKYNLPFCHDLHQYFVDIRKEERTSTEAPRGHAKTTVKCNLIPMFQACEEPDEFWHYANVQNTAFKALEVNRSIKAEFEDNDLMYELYGDMVGDRWTDNQFVVKHKQGKWKGREVVFSAIGAGQSIRGIAYRNRRPDYWLLDDLYNENEIYNVEATERINNWFWGTVYQARAKNKKCCIHVQGTAINPEDLLEKFKKMARWVSRTFDAIIDDVKKLVLWKELNTYDSLAADREEMGSIIFDREMRNQRWDETTTIIKPSWLKDWEFDPDQKDFNADNEDVVAVLLGCDPSIGENEVNDYTGACVVIKTRLRFAGGYNFYIMDLLEDHLSFDKRIRALQLMCANAAKLGYPVSIARIEGVAGFADFVAMVRKHTNIPVKTTDINGKPLIVRDKIATLINRSTYFENRHVFISKAIPEKKRERLRKQLITNLPKNDDLRDSVMLALDPKLSAPASGMASAPNAPRLGPPRGQQADWM